MKIVFLSVGIWIFLSSAVSKQFAANITCIFIEFILTTDYDWGSKVLPTVG